MSTEGVQYVIGRAVTNLAFREQLRSDPDSVLTSLSSSQDYAFTTEEVEAIKAMDWGGLEGVAHDLDQRISRARIIGTMAGADEEETCGCVKVGDKVCPEK